GGDRVHVTPELIEVSAAGAPTSKWQQAFDANLTDVFQVQSDVASKVAAALGVALAADDAKHLSGRPTENLAAYEAFLKGDEACSGMGATDPMSLRKALAFYEQAIALDPAFALAWARISVANAVLYFNGTPAADLDHRARAAAEKSIALTPGRPE